MKKLFTQRSYLTLAFLLLASMAFVAGVRTSVDGVINAAFLPVAIFATVTGYLLGFSQWTIRRAWRVVILGGLVVIFLEVSRTRELLWPTILYIPKFEFTSIVAIINKKPIDISFFQSQLIEASQRISVFVFELAKGNSSKEANSTLREVIWDFPILIFCAWSGWWSSRRNLILTALAPSLALHGWMLNYTGKHALSLQIEVFAFIFLLGVNQSWNLDSQNKNEDGGKARNDTLATLLIISFALALAAGLVPIFSIKDTAQKIAERQRLNETLGLERKVTESYTASSSGLPRDHLIKAPRDQLLNIVFVASTGERPFLNDEVAAPVIPRHYWRWLTYDIYNGQNWKTSPIQSNSYSANELLFQFAGTGYQIIHQVIKKSSPQDTRLYWTGSLLSASQPFETTWRVRPTSNPAENSLLSMDMLGSITGAQNYSADSILPTLNETQLRQATQAYPKDIRKKYLALPGTISPRVLNLSSELTSRYSNAYDKAKSIEAYLRAYPYTLDVPPLPADKEVADYFLFELKKGYCDYYATSMIVLARAAGLPARLVIGYASGDYDRAKAEYTVRELNAHSWVEIYFPKIGWVEFEPTGNQPLTILPVDSSQDEMHAPLLSTGVDSSGQAVSKPQYFPLILMLTLASLILLISSWFLREQGLLRSHKTIGSIYEYIFYHGKRIYKDAPLYETPSIFADQLRKQIKTGYPWLISAPDEIKLLTDLYIQETYSAHPITKDEHAIAVKVWRKLFWRLLYARVVLARSVGG